MSIIGTWVLAGFLILIVAGCCAWWLTEALCAENTISTVFSVITAIILITGIVIGAIYYLNETESGQRAIKTWESEIKGGIERTVTVYDVMGEPIKEYTGKFDVDYDESRIIFDDENGKRHIIYYTTGTITIDEK